MKGLGKAEKTIAEFSQTGIPHFKAKHQLYSLKANGRLIIVFLWFLCLARLSLLGSLHT